MAELHGYLEGGAAAIADNIGQMSAMASMTSTPPLALDAVGYFS